jgi:hypothetical protein
MTAAGLTGVCCKLRAAPWLPAGVSFPTPPREAAPAFVYHNDQQCV